MRVLVVYSTDSTPTAISTAGAEVLITQLKLKGVDVNSLNLFGATRLPFMLRLGLNRYDMICYFGHGTTDSLVGQLPIGLLQRLVDLSNKLVLDDKVVFTVACLSMTLLGRMIRGVYYGSTNYMYIAYPDFDHNYANDFIDTWVQIPLYLVDNWKDWYSALDAYKDKCSSYISLYESKKREWGNADAFSYCMRMNRDFYGVHVP